MAFYTKIILAVSFVAAIGCGAVSSSSGSIDLKDIAPAPTPEKNGNSAKNLQTAYFAGGCFWGIEAVFEHVKGVKDAVSGFSGGGQKAADYETVSGGRTGHAETVKVTFDPNVVSYQQLLYVFFAVAHDPTELNMQGPDHGTQYRSAIFYVDDEQKNAATAFIAAIESSHALNKPVVTEVTQFTAFFEAGAEHQNFARLNPDYPYIVINDAPKVVALKKKFPELYVEK